MIRWTPRSFVVIALSAVLVALSPGIFCYEAIAATVRGRPGEEIHVGRTQARTGAVATAPATADRDLDLSLGLSIDSAIDRLGPEAAAVVKFIAAREALKTAVKGGDEAKAWETFEKMEASLRAVAQAFPERREGAEQL